jgi:hypothetical protein
MLVERYRNHLIFVKADHDPRTGLWKAGTHVQFNEDPRTFRDVWLPRPIVGFKTNKNAERQAIKEARRWVDDRLREGNQATDKAISLDSVVLTNDQEPPQGNSQKEQESSAGEN